MAEIPYDGRLQPCQQLYTGPTGGHPVTWPGSTEADRSVRRHTTSPSILIQSYAIGGAGRWPPLEDPGWVLQRCEAAAIVRKSSPATHYRQQLRQLSLPTGDGNRRAPRQAARMLVAQRTGGFSASCMGKEAARVILSASLPPPPGDVLHPGRPARGLHAGCSPASDGLQAATLPAPLDR